MYKGRLRFSIHHHFRPLCEYPGFKMLTGGSIRAALMSTRPNSAGCVTKEGSNLYKTG
jgi:hypothetical protein